MPSNGTTANVVLHDLDLNVQGQTDREAILISKHWKMETLLLPSDRKSGICNRMAILQMLYSATMTKFSRSNISNIDISKTVRVSVKMRVMTFIDVGIRHLMVSLRLVTQTLTKLSRSNIISKMITDRANFTTDIR